MTILLAQLAGLVTPSHFRGPRNKEDSMDYVTLQVPEHLYLQTLAFVSAEHDEFLASAELVRENELLRKITRDQSEEIGRLRELYSNATTAAPAL